MMTMMMKVRKRRGCFSHRVFEENLVWIWDSHGLFSYVRLDHCFFCLAMSLSRLINTEDEEWNERLRVLQDARNLKKVAGWFRHPEAPIDTTTTSVGARCYFDRASAPERLSLEQVQEQEAVMADIMALKTQAQAFLHPERPVVVEDPTLFGRNYFGRPSAPEQEDEDDVEERELILQDMARLKQIATDYLHPERPVVAINPAVFGRCYFDRPSAPEKESFGAAEERARILNEAKQLKAQAELWLHPETPLVVDATATARCYFDRPSAPERDTFGAAEERARILHEAKQLKAQAELWLHPEDPLVVDATVTARCYFDRPSAPEKESFGAAEERARILAEARQLKAQAELWLHPEAPLEVDATATARCYFDRASAVEQETVGAAEERARILAEAKRLKALAELYHHPEAPILVDATATARCYFDRPSAPEQETFGAAEARAQILSQAKQFKAQADLWRHPERPVDTDPTAYGRNYFSRPSAPVEETPEYAEERARILAEAKQLKAQCDLWRHPEAKLVVDPLVFGRIYFSRPSAPEQETFGAAEQRARILAEVKQLKAHAVQFLHPEIPVVTSDPCATGRNYFSRPSAPEQVAAEDAEERARVLAEAKALKAQCEMFRHPEAKLVVDPAAFGRNYFSRPSAPQQEALEDAEERARCLADSTMLRKLATDYYHPELPVVSTDPHATGRNYFDRASAYIHDQMVHTFPVHEDDLHHDEHHDGEHQWDHFGMDEDMDHMFSDMRHDLALPAGSKANNNIMKGEGSEEGGNLSRSPSSVMLFSGEPIYD
jgi:hypothetical protein